MGLFSRRRTPAFTASASEAGMRDVQSGPQVIPRDMDFLNDMASDHAEPVTEKPVLVFARRLSHALAYTLPDTPVSPATETGSRYNEKRNNSVSGMNYDAVFKLTLEADELASDEEVEPQEQDVESLTDDHKRWSAILREAEEERPRHGRRHRRRRRSVSREGPKSRSKRRTSRTGTDSADVLDPDLPLSVSAPPITSPFPRLTVHYQDSSDDDEEPTITVSHRPSAGVLRSEHSILAVPVGDGFDALDVMADYLFRYGCEKKKWFERPASRSSAKRRSQSQSRVDTGVCIRAKTGVQRTFPLNTPGLAAFEAAVTALNPEVSRRLARSRDSVLMVLSHR
jgi:hypothetical protein